MVKAHIGFLKGKQWDYFLGGQNFFHVLLGYNKCLL